MFISVFTAQGCTHGVTSPPSSVLTIAALGDTSGYKIPKNEQDQSDPLQQVRHLIDPQDIFIYNLHIKRHILKGHYLHMYIRHLGVSFDHCQWDL